LISDLIIIDNALKDPHRLVKLAKEQKYYSAKEHKLASSNVTWAGYRSDLLHTIDHDLLNETTNELMDVTVKKTLGDTSTLGFNFKSMLSACFHYLTESDKIVPKWYHTDNDACFAGILYLSENPEPDSGTVILTDTEEVVVENKFNRFVLYRADYFHAAQGGFGKDLSDGRITTNFFIHQIEFNLNRK